MSQPGAGGWSAAVVKGTSWTAASRFGVQLLSIASTSIVARHVPPRAYGLVGMAMVVINFAGLFRDIGTASAIIQRKEIDDVLLTSVFWLNMFMSAAVTASCWVAAPWVAAFYHEPQLVAVFRALSVVFSIWALSNVHAALLSRHFQFSRVAAAELGAGAAGLVVAVACALRGAGVWSLVAASLTNAVASTLITIVAKPWRPKLLFSWNEIRSISGFGLNLSAFNMVNYFARSADNMLIGKYVGAAPLGYYGFSYNVMLYPVQSIAQSLGRVLFPALSTMQADHARFRQAYLRSSAAIAFVTFPLMAGATILAPELIAVLLGPRWAPTVPVFRILAPVGMLQSLTTITGQIYVAKGETGAMFWWGALFSSILVLGFVAGLPWGIVGVAAVYAALTCLLLIPMLAIPFRLIGLPLLALWKAIVPTVACSAGMATLVLGLRWALVRYHVTNVIALPVCIISGAAFYFYLMYRNRPAVLVDILTLAGARSPLLSRLSRRLL
jgi:O-antigen/teichoic acid export membrane protein